MLADGEVGEGWIGQAEDRVGTFWSCGGWRRGLSPAAAAAGGGIGIGYRMEASGERC